MSYYRRNLPHWQPAEAEYFITFRLANSLPVEAIQKIKREKEYLLRNSELKKSALRKEITRRVFEKYEHHLEKEHFGNYWLKEPKIARLVCDAIEYRDTKQYDLYAYCIMPNHVHLVFRLLKNNPDNKYPVTKIMQSLKRFTAGRANKVLGRNGQFWQHESFDRVIRSRKELESTIKYVLNNPVKAGLADQLQEWPYSYCKFM